MWAVEYTDEFEEWWNSITTVEQEAIAASVQLLEEHGPSLGRPHADSINQYSKHPNMKELRVQCSGNPIRICFAFDPRRVAILLIGGDKKGEDRWYQTYMPIADQLYDVHLLEISTEISKEK